MTESSILIIASMHRSGSSLVASLLQSAGLHIGRRLAPGDKGNIRGYFENFDFWEFHRALLESQGINTEGWTLQERIDVEDRFVDLANELVARNSLSMYWGWKDPRTTLVLDFWAELLPEAKFLLIYRSPWEVVDSLYRRGDSLFHDKPELAAKMWLHYNQKILNFYNRFSIRCLLVNLNSILNHPQNLVEAANQKFQTNFVTPEASIYEPSLLHTLESDGYRPTLIDHYFPEVVQMYQELDARAWQLDGAPIFQWRESIKPSLYRFWAFQNWRNIRVLETESEYFRSTLEQSQGQSDRFQAELEQTKTLLVQTQVELEQQQAQLGLNQAELLQLQALQDRACEEQERSKAQLPEYQSELEKSQSQQINTEELVEQSQEQLHQMEEVLEQSQSQLHQLQSGLEASWTREQQTMELLGRLQAKSQENELEFAKTKFQLCQTEAVLAQAQSQLQQTELAWGQSQSQLSDTQAELVQSQTQLHQAQIELEYSQNREQQIEELLEQSHTQLHQSQLEHEQSRNQLLQTEELLEQFKVQLHETETVLEQFQTQLQQSQSELEQSRIREQQTVEVLERSQEQLHQTEEVLEQSLTQLHQSQLEQEQSRNQLLQTEELLERSNAQLHQTEEVLEQSQAQLYETEMVLEQSQTQLQQLQLELEQSRRQLLQTQELLERSHLHLTEEVFEQSQDRLLVTEETLEQSQLQNAKAKLQLQYRIDRIEKGLLDRGVSDDGSLMQYDFLVWYAWHAYQTGDLSKMQEKLRQSMRLSCLTGVENILKWLDSFAGFAVEQGDNFDAFHLTNSEEWKVLVRRATNPKIPDLIQQK